MAQAAKSRIIISSGKLEKNSSATIIERWMNEERKKIIALELELNCSQGRNSTLFIAAHQQHSTELTAGLVWTRPLFTFNSLLSLARHAHFLTNSFAPPTLKRAISGRRQQQQCFLYRRLCRFFFAFHFMMSDTSWVVLACEIVELEEKM